MGFWSSQAYCWDLPRSWRWSVEKKKSCVLLPGTGVIRWGLAGRARVSKRASAWWLSLGSHRQFSSARMDSKPCHQRSVPEALHGAERKFLGFLQADRTTLSWKRLAACSTLKLALWPIHGGFILKAFVKMLLLLLLFLNPPTLIRDGFFKIGSYKLFVWGCFEPWSSWSLPPE
jgi:hypothetical protein